MNTIGDIRAKMTAILERKKIDYSADMANEIKSILLKNGKRGNKKQDLFGLRFGISGDVSKTENYIKKSLILLTYVISIVCSSQKQAFIDRTIPV